MAESLATQTHKSLLERANRVPELVDRTREKINLLREILYQESLLLGVDMTHTLKPILARQQDHEKVLKTVKAFQNDVMNHANKAPGNHQNSPARSRALTVSVRNRNLRNGETGNPPARVSHTKSLSTIHDGEQLGEIRTSFEPSFKKELPTGNQASTSEVPTKTTEKDASWYGSLDRNLVKKKKRNLMDRNRRHTKTVGSMAALERADYLQPDEQYEIGLPLDFSQVAVQTRSRSEAGVSAEFQMFPGPILPPKSTHQIRLDASSMGRPKLSVLEPRIAIHWLPPNSYPGAQDVPPSSRLMRMDSDMLHASSVESSVTKELLHTETSGKGWYETNLDDSFPHSRSESNSLAEAGSLDQTDSSSIRARTSISSPTNISENGSRSSAGSETRLSIANETCKPFEMSDYYKYSTKFRHHSSHTAPSERIESKQIRTVFKAPNTAVTQYNHEGVMPNFEKSNNFHFSSRDSNGNGHEQVPELPPKQKPKPVHVPRDSAYLDEEVAWVMDAPTFV